MELEVRQSTWEQLGSLEHWLRRLVDDELSPAFGPSFLDARRSSGRRLIDKPIAESIKRRRARDTDRYPRVVDALTLGELVNLIADSELFLRHFRPALGRAFWTDQPFVDIRTP